MRKSGFYFLQIQINRSFTLETSKDTKISMPLYSANFKHLCLLVLLLAEVLKGKTQCVEFNDSVTIISGINCSPETFTQANLSRVQFSKARNNRINLGIAGNNYYYILLKVSSPCTLVDQSLSIDNTSLDTVNVYRIDSTGKSQLLYQGGNRVIFKIQRNYIWHTVPVLIDTVPTYYLIALKAPQKNINVRYEILSRNKLQKKYQGYDHLVFFYIGIVSLIIAILLLAIILFKKRVFAVYLGYIICFSGWILSHYGYLFPYIYPRVPIINEIAKPVCSLWASFFLLRVLQIVFRYQLISLRWFSRLIKLLLYILPTLAVFMLLLLVPTISSALKASLITAWHIGLIFSICTIVLIPLYFIKSGSLAKIFSLAMFVICIMSILQFIANSGYSNNFFINEHGMTMGSLFEVSIMAFGLFYSLMEEKKLKERQVLALEREQTETLKKLITVQDSERKRIAGDLHDNIGPLLSALKINFRRIVHTMQSDNQVKLVAKTESIIDDSIAEVRNIAHNLMPKGLSSKGLITTLADYFESIRQLYNIPIVFHHQIESVFHPELQINVYRIICELVLNAAKHSNALLITVHIIGDSQKLLIFILDNGTGFQPNSGGRKKSLGLQNVENRVLYLKGKFSITTEPGKGAVIDIEIPL